MTRHITLALFLVGALLWSTACNETNPNAADDEAFVVPPGKADNFFSLSAQEYYVQGDYYVELSSTEAALPAAQRDARVKELVYYKQVAVNWFLLQYLLDPENPEEHKYHSLTKNGAYEDLAISPDPNDPRRYTFRFQQEVAGDFNLLDALPTTIGPDGLHRFNLPVGKVSNTQLSQLEINNEWYRRSPWSGFDPAAVSPSQVEYLELTIFPQVRSNDAWPDYQALFADGVVDVGIHFGWDYHGDYHMVHSRDIYNWLVANHAFTSPVARYEDYTRHSGPLSKTILAGGQPVTFNIWLYWGQVGTETDPDTDAGGRILEEDMRTSFRSREVIIFSGHSGPFYGFALANWKKTDEGDLDDAKIASLDLLPDTYQVVLAEGCDTYAIGQAFRDNPAKRDASFMDVITTTSYSNASTAGVVRNFLLALFDNQRNQHVPWKYSELLRRLDANSTWFKTMYGVHGIDDNPRLHPYARLENFCVTCSKDADCGPAGNKCVRINDNERVCTAECLGDDGCPAGYACTPVASGRTVTSHQCIPTTFTCTQLDIPTDSPYTLIINEVLADPPLGLEGDANRDGLRHGVEDEFIELINVSTKALDISGWSIADAVTVRHVFPFPTSVAPGEVIVVFGGGQPQVEGVRTFVSTGLALNNSGDHVQLLDGTGAVIDALNYGAEGGQKRSLTRAIDADPTSDFVQHPGELSYSAGTRHDGSRF